MQPTPFPSSPDEDDRAPLVLLLGNVDHEGITSPLKSGGANYKKKLLESAPHNWSVILGYFYGYAIRAVVMKLGSRVYELIALPQYSGIAHELFEKIALTRHAVFVFEELLSRRPESNDRTTQSDELRMDTEAQDEKESEYYGGKFELRQPSTQVLEVVNEMLREHRLNIIPYRTNAEVTVIASQLLKDALEGLLFRIYVPSGRLWADEVDRLLQLFRDYLARTGRKGVRLDQVRTDRGILYEFHGDDAPHGSSLSDDFEDFSRFLDLCVSNPPEAEAMLRQKTVEPREISGILTRYSKEAKRLQVDLRHDRERKLLEIRQRLESELADIFPGGTDWNVIERFVATAIPEAYSIASLSSADRMYSRALPVLDSSQLTVNINPQIIQTVHGIVAQEIRGDVNVSEESERLLQLIEQHAGQQTSDLTAAAQMLSDAGISKPDRLMSAHKLKAFVFNIAKKIGPVATSLLTTYIENKLGLK
jgi:hypothetical protein